MAITACIPAGNTEPCVALIPSVLVTIRMIAAADNITISIMEDIPSVTISPSMRKLGRIPSKDPKRTIKAVAAYVPCGRNVYLAVAECSSGNNGNVVDRRDWMVHENKDFLFCILLSAERNGRNITVVISSQSGNSRNPISKSSYEK